MRGNSYFGNSGREKSLEFVVPTDISRSRQELSKEYSIAKIGVDTIENEPSKA